MKVEFTLGQILEGRRKGLSFEEIAKECGNKDDKKAGKEIEAQYNEILSTLKEARSSFKNAMDILEKKEKHFIKDNKGLEDELETTIDDFSFSHIEENLRFSTVNELLAKSSEQHLVDLTKWATEKLDKRKELIRKTKEELKKADGIKVVPRHLFLYLFKIDGSPNKTKHVPLVKMASGRTDSGVDDVVYADCLKYTRNGIKGRKKDNFDKIKADIENPLIEAVIKKKLNLI